MNASTAYPRIIGYMSAYSAGIIYCAQCLDTVNTCAAVYEGTEMECIYCGDAWVPFVGMTQDERFDAELAERGDKHCDECMSIQPMFAGDLCDLCVSERVQTQPYTTRPNMDLLNDMRVYPVELVAARLECLAADREYMRIFLAPESRMADWQSAANYRASAELVFDRECRAYANR